jgi:hypothetical protein
VVRTIFAASRAQGPADVARHVIDTRFEPLFREVDAILGRGERNLSGLVHAISWTRVCILVS